MCNVYSVFVYRTTSAYNIWKFSNKHVTLLRMGLYLVCNNNHHGVTRVHAKCSTGLHSAQSNVLYSGRSWPEQYFLGFLCRNCDMPRVDGQAQSANILTCAAALKRIKILRCRSLLQRGDPSLNTAAARSVAAQWFKSQGCSGALRRKLLKEENQPSL